MVSSRVSGGNGCPYCSGQKVLTGYNDLCTTNSDIAFEWHPTKNGDLLPSMVSAGTAKKVWWICPVCKKSYQTAIYHRTNGKGCPYCSSRIIESGVNDLASLNPTLATEWNFEKNGDLLPSMVSFHSGRNVWWKCSLGHEWQATVANRVKDRGCPYCAGKKVLLGFNDLTTTNPILALEWHPTKNEDLLPTMVTSGSHKKVWWICKDGHEWKTEIVNRTTANTGCPYCSGKKVLSGVNDLFSKKPKLASEWHPTMNGDLLPIMVSANSHKKVWWLCKNGHEWQAEIANRNAGNGCPICRKYKKRS